MEFCLTCDICCRFPEKNSPLVPFFLGNERGAYYGCRADTIKHCGGYICPYFLFKENKCGIYGKRPLDCRLYPYMITYDQGYKKAILVLDNHCPHAKEFKLEDKIPEIKEPDIGFINDPQDNASFVKELPELTNFVFGNSGRFRKLKAEDGHVIPYLWKDILNILYDKDADEVYYNFRKFPKEDKDYVYLKKDLAELKGDRYKDKRNLCNYFEKNYSYKVTPLSPKDEHLALYKKWAENKYKKNLSVYEKQLIEDSFFFHKRAFLDYNALKLSGIEIKIDDNIVGYTFGFGHGDTFYILGEITDQSFKGINQFIFREFCRLLPDNFIYINTMDDSEIDGLRRNKLSYKPIIGG